MKKNGRCWATWNISSNHHYPYSVRCQLREGHYGSHRRYGKDFDGIANGEKERRHPAMSASRKERRG